MICADLKPLSSPCKRSAEISESLKLLLTATIRFWKTSHALTALRLRETSLLRITDCFSTVKRSSKKMGYLKLRTAVTDIPSEILRVCRKLLKLRKIMRRMRIILTMSLSFKWVWKTLKINPPPISAGN